MITLNAYAKLNLALAVTGVRQDGYHELDTIMQSVSLCDIVTVKKARGISVAMDKPWADENDNAAFKAAEAFLSHTGADGASITIHKNIPRMAGLGGASADAAAVLTGLDRLYESHLSTDALINLAESVGADVPFAVTGGLARAKGIGEKLKFLKAEKPLYYVVIKPHDGVSTAQAFARFNASEHISIESVEFAVLKGDAALFSKFSGNALGLAALAIAPGMLNAASALKAAAAGKAFMTGSGSAMFAVCETPEQAQQAARRVQGDFELCVALSPVNRGVEVVKEDA